MTREGRIRTELAGDHRTGVHDGDDKLIDGGEIELEAYETLVIVEVDMDTDTHDGTIKLPHPALNPGAVYHIELDDTNLHDDAEVFIKDVTGTDTLATITGTDTLHATFMSVGRRMVKID